MSSIGGLPYYITAECGRPNYRYDIMKAIKIYKQQKTLEYECLKPY